MLVSTKYGHVGIKEIFVLWERVPQVLLFFVMIFNKRFELIKKYRELIRSIMYLLYTVLQCTAHLTVGET